MSIADLPKHYHGGSVRLSPKEKKRLEEWVLREGWTREKTLNNSFQLGHDMPRNLIAPGVPEENWGGNGKCVCPMCGYVTTVTNVCRGCTEMPADEELTQPRYCKTHGVAHNVNGKWTGHRSLYMVCVS